MRNQSLRRRRLYYQVGGSQTSVLESFNPASLPRGEFSASATDWRQFLRRAVRADVLANGGLISIRAHQNLLERFVFQELGIDLGVYAIVDVGMPLNDV